MVRECQDDGGQGIDVVRLAEAIRQMCGAITTLTSSNVHEGQRRAAADEALAAADEARNAAGQEIGRLHERNIRMEARMAEWDVPPVCDCKSMCYEVYCRKCGKQLM